MSKVNESSVNVRPVVVPTVVACKEAAPSTVSPPEEYSDDPEMVVARTPVREVDPDTLSVPPVYTNTFDAEMFVNDTLDVKLAWPHTFKVFTTCTFESVARPAQRFKAEPRIVTDPDTSRATVGSLPIPSHMADRSPCKNGIPLVVEYILKKLLCRGVAPPGLLPR
jgi:hypothetical protein